MNLRPWVAAPLAGAAIALVSPSAGVAAQASALHASGSLWLHGGDGDHGHHSPWRDCYSRRRVVLIDHTLRAILTNGRRGPEALVLLGGSGSSSSSPAAPWDSFSVATYLDVNYPVQPFNQYVFTIRDFFRVHPLFVVKAFDRHARAFPFPAAHCTNDEGDGDRGDRARPLGGPTADGSGSSGHRLPRKGDHHQNGQGEQETLAPGSAIPSVPRDTTAAGWSAGLLSANHIVIAAGGLLMILGMLAVAWRRRHRSAA